MRILRHNIIHIKVFLFLNLDHRLARIQFILRRHSTFQSLTQLSHMSATLNNLLRLDRLFIVILLRQCIPLRFVNLFLQSIALALLFVIHRLQLRNKSILIVNLCRVMLALRLQLLRLGRLSFEGGTQLGNLAIECTHPLDAFLYIGLRLLVHARNSLLVIGHNTLFIRFQLFILVREKRNLFLLLRLQLQCIMKRTNLTLVLVLLILMLAANILHFEHMQLFRLSQLILKLLQIIVVFEFELLHLGTLLVLFRQQLLLQFLHFVVFFFRNLFADNLIVNLHRCLAILLLFQSLQCRRERHHLLLVRILEIGQLFLQSCDFSVARAAAAAWRSTFGDIQW
mmetsp:Transcript_55708/g.92711  ORF Transcript_55708/g.92711 Transcript_55708/m.92711 type:complete len:340 (+) Transcript_55708:581-1600(+)